MRIAHCSLHTGKNLPGGVDDGLTVAQRLRLTCPNAAAHSPTVTDVRCDGCTLYFGQP